MKPSRSSFWPVWVLAGVLAAVAPAVADHAHDHAPDGGHHAQHGHHEHRAPHGGTLVVLGDEVAHVELVLDAASGELTAYVLDGEAERAVRIAQPTIDVTVTRAGAEPFRVALAAKGSALTGETVGDTSELTGRDERLVGAQRFRAELGPVSVKGVAFPATPFDFPQGNEPPAEHGAGAATKDR